MNAAGPWYKRLMSKLDWYTMPCTCDGTQNCGPGCASYIRLPWPRHSDAEIMKGLICAYVGCTSPATTRRGSALCQPHADKLAVDYGIGEK